MVPTLGSGGGRRAQSAWLCWVASGDDSQLHVRLINTSLSSTSRGLAPPSHGWMWWSTSPANMLDDPSEVVGLSEPLLEL